MRNKRFVKHTSRAFAILMSAMMAVGIAMPVNAAGKKDSKKEDKTETVYVNANADGSVDKITVSDWLKNHSSSDTLEDFSNLENIKNVKGDETFTQNADGSIVWDSKACTQLRNLGFQLFFRDQNGLDVIIHAHDVSPFYPFKFPVPSAGSASWSHPVQGPRQSRCRTPKAPRCLLPAAAACPAAAPGCPLRSSICAGGCAPLARRGGKHPPAGGYAEQDQHTTWLF